MAKEKKPLIDIEAARKRADEYTGLFGGVRAILNEAGICLYSATRGWAGTWKGIFNTAANISSGFGPVIGDSMDRRRTYKEAFEKSFKRFNKERTLEEGFAIGLSQVVEELDRTTYEGFISRGYTPNDARVETDLYLEDPRVEAYANERAEQFALDYVKTKRERALINSEQRAQKAVKVKQTAFQKEGLARKIRKGIETFPAAIAQMRQEAAYNQYAGLAQAVGGAFGTGFAAAYSAVKNPKGGNENET